MNLGLKGFEAIPAPGVIDLSKQFKREVDKCLLDALLGPWGVMELGYTANIEKIKGNNKLEVNIEELKARLEAIVDSDKEIMKLTIMSILEEISDNI